MKGTKKLLLSLIFQGIFLLGCISLNAQSFPKVPQWTTYETVLTSNVKYDRPYTDVEVWFRFRNNKGDTLVRPAFWDGGNTWKVRFCPPDSNGQWNWISYASNTKDEGLHKQSGAFEAVPYSGKNGLIKNGLLRMSQDRRNVMQHSGKSFLVVADTPWAIPFRATKEQVVTYAKDRKQKGFNTALMMTLQPDVNAKGPNLRNVDQGFKRAFSDLENGHINELDVTYFHYFDSLVAILLEHEIVPVFQPVFHGFGWKGQQVLGPLIQPEEYVRYTRYLLARYGSNPALWLISADHDGNDPGVKESGEMLQKWDAYEQPVGIHYNPCDDYVAEWALNDPTKKCMHFNKTHQEKEWLDFQWAQTGHGTDHQYHKVEKMYDHLPIKAVANGESTYEGMNAGKNGLGWWQGEDAWMQLMHGGTMGVVYGAAGLWQWKISSDEKGWTSWADQPLSWEGALQLEGATYVGLVGKILNNFDLIDVQKKWGLANGKPLLAKEGILYISYLNEGGELTINDLPKNGNYQWYNPKTGNIKQFGKVSGNTFKAPDDNPWVLVVFFEQTSI